MANEFHYFQGKAAWAKLITPDMKYNKWSLKLYPDAESLVKFKNLQERGILNRLKRDDEGDHFALSRGTERKASGKVIGMSPPLVLEADGKTPFTGNIGNGSDVTCKCVFYSGEKPFKYAALRLESVRIDNLVPYVSNRDFNKEEHLQAAGLTDQPAQLF